MPTNTSQHVYLQGGVQPLRKATTGTARRLGGWLTTYGKIGADGGVVPTVDRDDQVMEAARDLGAIDWAGYVKGGRWNDTHDEATLVGLPDTLEYHDGTTELSKSHGKVGFWTTGHLFDRAEPSSWAGLTDPAGHARAPSEHELTRADHFWRLAELLKGTPRTLGLSVHGLMALSKCRRRIVFAQINHAAVCELPVNPDATLEPLELGRSWAVLRKAMDAEPATGPCGACTCPVGRCRRGNDLESLVGLLASRHGLSHRLAETMARQHLGL